MESNADVELAGWSALSLLEVHNVRLECRYYPYAELKATARLENGTVRVRVSDGFSAASQDVLTGLMLYLCSRLFRKRLAGNEEGLVRRYKEFVAQKSSATLSHTLRRMRHRAPAPVPEGSTYDLQEISSRVQLLQENVLAGVLIPEITWSAGIGSRRTLAYHDPAINRIVVSRKLDSPRIPRMVLEYVVFHELLHAKHEVKYACGKSMRRTVHTREFNKDERSFPYLAEAEEWLERHRI